MKIDNDKIVAYLSNELNSEEKNKFEKEIQSNNTLRFLLDDIHNNDMLLHKMNNYTVSSDFMVKLNEKIHEHNQTIIPWHTKIFNRIPSFKSLPQFSSINQYALSSISLSILLIVTFTLFKVNQNSSNYANDDNLNQNLIATADDSLSTVNDSLNFEEPTLLYSKDK